MTTLRAGMRATYTGSSGRHNIPCRIIRITRTSIWVKWDHNGLTEQVHPDDLRP